jgi:hypothetical protein
MARVHSNKAIRKRLENGVEEKSVFELYFEEIPFHDSVRR